MNLENFRPMNIKKKPSGTDNTDSFSVSSFQTFSTYAGQTMFELKYMTGHPVEYFLSNGEALPSTCMLAECMRETEMARLFTREDLYEFLFRLQILFQICDPVESWLMDGHILSYTYKGEEQKLKLEDIIMHFGFEAYDHYINYTSRTYFFERVPSSLNFALKVGYNAYIPGLQTEEFYRIENKLLCAPIVTPETIASAEFFASDVMKAIPEEAFTIKSRTFLEKEKELQERQQRIRNIELPGIRKIGEETLRNCFRTIFWDDLVDEILSDPGKFEADGRKPLYVGWVFANCFMRPDGSFTPERGIFIRDFMDYEIDEGSRHDSGRSNLSYNVEFERMEKMAPYLKGVPL